VVSAPTARAARGRLPSVAALAALGPLLCLSLARDRLLAGWHRARSCDYLAHVGSDGLRECLRFRDDAGAPCWCLHALPEDDFLAWERVIARVPAAAANDDGCNLVERLWRDLADALCGDRWQAQVIRIHAPDVRHGEDRWRLAVSEPAIAGFSHDVARRIALAERASFPADVRLSAPAAKSSMRTADRHDWRIDPVPTFLNGHAP
jgi:hypothetical protein